MIRNGFILASLQLKISLDNNNFILKRKYSGILELQYYLVMENGVISRLLKFKSEAKVCLMMRSQKEKVKLKVKNKTD